MAQISLFSNEVLMKIFNSLEEISDIAECRLVCKKWNIPAEETMLGAEIHINSEDTVFDLYTVLIRYPAKVNRIKHLNLGATIRYNRILDKFLQVALTPNIESLAIAHPEDSTLTTVTDIVKKSAIKFSKMKHLSVIPPFTMNDILYELCFLFSSSLQSMGLNLGTEENNINYEFVKSLKDYRNLVNLALNVDRETVPAIDDILDECPHLQTLTVECLNWTEMCTDIYTARTTTDQSRVLKHDNLTTVSIIDSDCPPVFVEYFLMKSSRLEKIHVEVTFHREFFKEKMEHIYNMIQKVPQRELFYLYSINDGVDIVDVLLDLKQPHSATIIIMDVKDTGDVKIKIE